MSMCPNSDIHSVYLDNELPEEYRQEYEKHLAECPKCMAELNKIKSIHQALASDRDSFKLTQNDLDSSYARMQARLSYSKITQKSQKVSSSAIKTRMSYFVAAAAAAAAVAVVVPTRLRSTTETIPAFEPVARTSLVPSTTQVSMDGNLSSAQISGLFSMGENTEAAVYTTSVNTRAAFASYDVFFAPEAASAFDLAEDELSNALDELESNAAESSLED